MLIAKGDRGTVVSVPDTERCDRYRCQPHEVGVPSDEASHRKRGVHMRKSARSVAVALILIGLASRSSSQTVTLASDLLKDWRAQKPPRHSARTANRSSTLAART